MGSCVDLHNKLGEFRGHFKMTHDCNWMRKHPIFTPKMKIIDYYSEILGNDAHR